MYRVAFRSSARSAALVRQSPRCFSSSPFDAGTPPPPPPPPRGKLGRKKLVEGEGALNASDIVENLSHKLGLPKSTCKSVVSATFDFIGAVSPWPPTGFSFAGRSWGMQFYCIPYYFLLTQIILFVAMRRLWPITSRLQSLDLAVFRPSNQKRRRGEIRERRNRLRSLPSGDPNFMPAKPFLQSGLKQV